MNVLEVNNLTKSLGKREIIKGISFNIKSGEIFGFLGPNGAGKTTTIRMLVGLINPTSGEIKICGHDLKNDTKNALREVGAVVENPELYKYLSGRENLMQIARIRNVSKEDVEETIKLVGLEGRIDDKVKKYSLGMKQRLGLAASLLSKPKLLILDEPTTGIDAASEKSLYALLNKLNKESKITIIIVSHDFEKISQYTNKIFSVNKNKVSLIYSKNGV